MNHKLVYSLAVFFLLTSFCIGQKAEKNYFNIKQISQEQGFSQSTVTAIAKDKVGFMWFGTQVGLVRYDGYNFIVYTANAVDSNSISDSFIQSLFVDNEGIIWVGGAINGLSSINPYTGKISKYNLGVHLQSEGQNKIMTIAQDKNGLIWIGTAGGGLFYSDKYKKQFSQIKTITVGNNIIVEDNITTILCSKNNLLSVTIENSNIGLIEIDANSNLSEGKYQRQIFDNLDTKKNKNIFCSSIDSKDNIWLVSGFNTVIKRKFNSSDFELYSDFYDDDTKCENIHIRTIFSDSKDNVWIGTTADGVYVKFNDSKKFVKVQNSIFFEKNSSCNHVICISDDKSGAIWFGTLSCGLLNLEQKKSIFKLYPGRNAITGQDVIESISCVFVDSQDRTWKGVLGAGVFFKAKNESFFKQFKPKKDETNGKGLKDIFCIEEDEKCIYFGSNSSGFSAYNKKNGILKYILKNNKSFKPYASCDVKFGDKIIFGTWGNGICYIKKNSDVPEYSSTTDSKTPIKLNDVNINCLAVYDNKYLLVGTEKGGLNVFDLNLNLLRIIKKEKNVKSISNDYIICAVVDKHKRIWLGTYGTGVDLILNLEDYLLKKGEGLEIINFNKGDKLCDDNVLGIVTDNKNSYWMSTVNGLSKFTFKPVFFYKSFHQTYWDSQISDLYSVKNYTSEDGLPSNEFNTGGYASTKSGEIFLGTNKGIFSFTPTNFVDTTFIAPVVLTQFKLFEKEYALDTTITYKKHIQLTYKESFFSFEFAALNFSLSETNDYAYMMEGFDKDWIYSGSRRFASYTNLDPGEYTFRVKASNNDGVWNELGTYVKISISPPWYKTIWAYLLLTAIIIGAIYIFIKYREVKLREEKKILEEKVEERTLEIAIINKEITKKNVDITDSINYAKRIQQAILPPIQDLQENFQNSFIFYKPKDIVSGDFYWLFKSDIENQEKQVLIAAADCTGHGVPGAFMSMISIDKLNEAAKYYTEPSKILESLNIGIKSALRQSADTEGQSRDGLDIALVRIITVSNNIFEVSYAGANRPLWILRQNETEIDEIKATKAAIGGFTDEKQDFKQSVFTLKSGDAIYIFSDGYPDQFGGDLDKKFMTKKLKELIVNTRRFSMQEQGRQLETTLKSWQGNYEQVDDILVMGVKF